MSGHSKWSNIKNRKAAVDEKKGKIFGQLARNIRFAVKENKSGDPKFNTTLRLLLDKARAVNMPNEKIQKAINIGLGQGPDALVNEVVYEGYGPGGVGLLIVSLTNNNNRTSGELRFLLGQFNGSLGSPGSVMYMFSRGENGEFVCSIPYEISDKSHIMQIKQLIDQLLAHEDVEEVYTSAIWEENE